VSWAAPDPRGQVDVEWRGVTDRCGGGAVWVWVDRATLNYPPPGTEVVVRTVGVQANPVAFREELDRAWLEHLAQSRAEEVDRLTTLLFEARRS
jgi:hypothetical protein